MTSAAFIFGVIPLAFGSGPGSELRQALGVAVFFGMIGVTVFGLVFTPLFYVLCRKLAARFSRAARAARAVRRSRSTRVGAAVRAGAVTG